MYGYFSKEQACGRLVRELHPRDKLPTNPGQGVVVVLTGLLNGLPHLSACPHWSLDIKLPAPVLYLENTQSAVPGPEVARPRSDPIDSS